MPVMFPLMRRIVITGAVALAMPLPARADVPAGTVPMLPPMPAPVARLAPRQPALLARRVAAGATPGQQCRQAIRAAERTGGIPDQLMAAIGRIESGRREADGAINPWPWSINVEGEDHIFETKAEAVAAVRALQARGTRSIDVGCMQVNLMYHPDAFASLDEAFDPAANAAFAARFLVQLHEQTGTWPTATAWYHSATPELGADYRRKVMAVWPEEKLRKEESVRSELASAWAATRSSASISPVAPVTSGFLLPRPGGTGRLLPQPSGTIGRGLDAYRAVPVVGQFPLPIRQPARQQLLHEASSGG
jgi:hypothetical protein